MRDFHRSHKDRLKASLNPHEKPRETLQKPAPAFGGNKATAGMPPIDRAADQVQAAPSNIIEHEAGQTVGTPSADRAPDGIQAAPPNAIEREVGQTVGMTSADHSADKVRAASLVIEHKGKRSVVIVMVVVGLGLVGFLFGRPHAKRVSPAIAMPSSEWPQEYLLSSLSSRPGKVEADPGAASCADSVKKVFDAIEEAVAEMSSSRQPRTLL